MDHVINRQKASPSGIARWESSRSMTDRRTRATPVEPRWSRLRTESLSEVVLRRRFAGANLSLQAADARQDFIHIVRAPRRRREAGAPRQ